MSHSDHFADSDVEFMRLMERARDGSEQAVGELIERCRPYLLLIANQELDPIIRAKVGASDIVQESLVTAEQCLRQFEGDTERDLLAWLRGIVINDLKETRRRYRGTEKRDVLRERPLDGDSTIGWPSLDMPADDLTPGADAIANEEMIVMRYALEKLPEDYRDVIRLRNWQQLSFADIGHQMKRTSEASRKLWSRAITQLQEELDRHIHTSSPGPPSE